MIRNWAFLAYIMNKLQGSELAPSQVGLTLDVIYSISIQYYGFPPKTIMNRQRIQVDTKVLFCFLPKRFCNALY